MRLCVQYGNKTSTAYVYTKSIIVYILLAAVSLYIEAPHALIFWAVKPYPR